MQTPAEGTTRACAGFNVAAGAFIPRAPKYPAVCRMLSNEGCQTCQTCQGGSPSYFAV
jgi:hypothetical protein